MQGYAPIVGFAFLVGRQVLVSADAARKSMLHALKKHACAATNQLSEQPCDIEEELYPRPHH